MEVQCVRLLNENAAEYIGEKTAINGRGRSRSAIRIRIIIIIIAESEGKKIGLSTLILRSSILDGPIHYSARR